MHVRGLREPSAKRAKRAASRARRDAEMVAQVRNQATELAAQRVAADPETFADRLEIERVEALAARRQEASLREEALGSFCRGLQPGDWFRLGDNETCRAVRAAGKSGNFWIRPRQPDGSIKIRPWLLLQYSPEENQPLGMLRPGSTKRAACAPVVLPHRRQHGMRCALTETTYVIPGGAITLSVDLLRREKGRCHDPSTQRLLSRLKELNEHRCTKRCRPGISSPSLRA